MLIVIEAQSIAVPKLLPGQDALEIARQFVAKIATVQYLRTTGGVDVLIPSDIEKALFELDCYPFWDPIKKLLQVAGLEGNLDFRDVVRVAQQVIEDSSSLELACAVSDVLFVDAKVESPAVLSIGQVADEHVCRASIISEVGFAKEQLRAKPQFFSPLCLAKDELRTSCNLHEIEPPHGHFGDLPANATTRHRVASSVDDLLSTADLSISEGSLTANKIRGTIELAIAKEFSLRIEDVIAVRDQWVIQKSFIASCERLGIHNRPDLWRRTIRAIYETLWSVNMGGTHWLRESKAADSPQVKHKDYGAWRRDVDHEYHLHYWQLGLAKRLANLDVHNNFTITIF
jgi:hypothetical protein